MRIFSYQRIEKVTYITLILIGFSTFRFPLSVSAAAAAAEVYPVLTYRYDHYLFTINPNLLPSWRKTEEVWQYNGEEIHPPAMLRVDGDSIPDLPEGMVRSLRLIWNRDAITETIAEIIAPSIDRSRGTVSIDTDTDGNIIFDGVGLLGRTVDIAVVTSLTIEALEQNVSDIILPVSEQQPIIHVLDSTLSDRGITEVVTIGESNFAGSTVNRRHNIAVGLEKFNGHIIPQDTVFSFNETLGPVNGATGYRKELVILGDKTLPDYGGGLCQVSTTAYRGVWEYGFPIEQRRNHSFAVSYYAPQGTDATIYPPYTDIKFRNDSSGDLLMQTYFEGDQAYFIYYGTKDDRMAEVIGPYVWDRRSPPVDRIEYTDTLAPGAKKKVGTAVPGMQAAWFRIVQSPDSEERTEPVYSFYEARPNFTQVGKQLTIPSWIGE